MAFLLLSLRLQVFKLNEIRIEIFDITRQSNLIGITQKLYHIKQIHSSMVVHSWKN